MNRNDRAIVGLVMLAHAMVHTYELSIPILVSIWLEEFPVTPATIGLVVTIGTALFGLGALPAGVLADAFGSQRLIAACLAGMGGSFLLLSVAPSIAGVTVALVLWGTAASVYHPSGLSLVSKGVRRRGSAFAYHGMAGNVGIAMGPLVTALLLVAFDWRTVVAVLSLPAGAAALFALRVDVDETAAVDGESEHAAASGSIGSLGAFLGDSRTLFGGAFLAVFGVVVLSGLYYRGVTTFLPELLGDLPMFAPVTLGTTELDPAQYAYAGLLMVGIAGQYVGGRLTDRLPTEWGLAGAFGALVVVTLAFVPAAGAGLLPLLAVSAALGFVMFVVQPMYQATVAEYTPAGARGLSYGYTYLGVFGVGALGAVVAGTVLTYGTRTDMFAVFAVVAGAASGLGVLLSVRRRRTAAAADAAEAD